MAGPLSGKSILVAEDLYLVALPVCEAMVEAGARIVGPYASCAEALAAAETGHIDAAVLDIGLSDGWVFPLARKLQQARIPFLFMTGYGPEVIPPEFAGVPMLLKPAHVDLLCERLARLANGASGAR